ncbi:hypothetical protein QP445_14875, partial [Micrococcus luteus]|nr:hypothetical protein [Micrococcus luteus]
IISFAERHNELEQRYAKHDEIVNQVLLEVAYAIRKHQTTTRDAAIQAVIEANYPAYQVAITDAALSSATVDMSKQVRWQLTEQDNQHFSTVYK